MSTNNRIGRNPFEKANKLSMAVTPEKAEKPSTSDKSKKVLKTSNNKAKKSSPSAFVIQETAPAAQAQEDQIIGELIELPEESWQPLTAAPAGFIKQLFARWL